MTLSDKRSERKEGREEGSERRGGGLTFFLEGLSHSTGGGGDHGRLRGAPTHTGRQEQSRELVGTQIEVGTEATFQ